MVEQAVKDGRGDDIIAKDAPPIAVALVAGDDDGPFLVTPRNELKEQVSLEAVQLGVAHLVANQELRFDVDPQLAGDRKSTRLNSSHVRISYAVFCLKKKNKML